MIGPAPEFTNSKYFESKPTWHLKDGADDKLKREFEKYENSKDMVKMYKESYPDMKNPYYTWQGKIVDKG